jgi:large subunit ribosomal protein L1
MRRCALLPVARAVWVLLWRAYNMAHISKRYKALIAKIDRNKLYAVNDALNLAKDTAKAKFDESIDIAINLGIDARKSDQLVRGAVVLPKGTGKTVRIAVFAQGAKAEEAKAAGADVVGFEDLAESIQAGNMDFDVVIASPDAMRIVGQLGQILGPRGLMPNPKVGTVSVDVAGAVRNAKAGQVQYRTDKNGVVQCTIGRASFTSEALRENLLALVDALNKARPAAAKGVYLKKVSVSSTMGVGIRIEQASLAG